MPGECLEEGECAPGDTDETPCDMCGEKTRYCDLECSWSEWDESGCFGDCAPGETDYDITSCFELGEIQPTICNNECSWQNDGICTSNCEITPRAGNNDFKDEICITGGAFLMGSADPMAREDETPQHTVYLTPYLIDKYEVTNSRYLECVVDGACTPPPSYTMYDEPDMQDHPVVQVTYYQALEFCEWDGGRTLPTEAQWEKAAKGPAPRDPNHPWGNDEPDCNLASGNDCHPCMTDPVNMYIDGVSYYGVSSMAGNASEWCWDYYGADYYANAPDLDPRGPNNGTERVRRGWEACRSFYLWDPSTKRRLHMPPSDVVETILLGFRCARRGY
jgi:formylglycine-generating enzyme required for sulfatase activity